MNKILCLLAGLLALSFLSGCSPREPRQQLNVFAWSEYLPEEVLEAFTQETGIRVNYETYASGEEMLAKLLAGGVAYDIIQPPDYIAEVMIKEGMLTRLDRALLDNLGNILPEFRGMPHDPADAYTVPYLAGTVGLVVNTERVTKPIRGLRDVFGPEHRGRIVVVDDGRELVTAALYTLGLGINDITPATLEQVRPVLAEWFPLIRVFDSDSPKTPLLNGDVDIGYVWSGEAALLWAEDPKFQYILPEEGAHLFVDLLAIPAGARNAEAAHQFINFLLRPKVSQLISQEFPYTNPNGAARALLSPEELANPASYPVVTKPLDTFRHIPGVGDLTDALITDLKNRAAR
jgi:spermidine/putrescine-binding protein